MTFTFGFNAKLPNAERTAKDHAAELVTAISDSTREALRNLIERAIRDGIAPRDAARMIRGMVGMTTQQAQGAMNYRESLVELGHTPAAVEKLTERYVDRKIAERAENIARTEIMSSLNEGASEAWRQAQEAGLISPTATRVWSASGRANSCPLCQALDGTEALIGEPFIGDDGESYDDPPAHPSCACSCSLNPYAT